MYNHSEAPLFPYMIFVLTSENSIPLELGNQDRFIPIFARNQDVTDGNGDTYLYVKL